MGRGEGVGSAPAPVSRESEESNRLGVRRRGMNGCAAFARRDPQGIWGRWSMNDGHGPACAHRTSLHCLHGSSERL